MNRSFGRTFVGRFLCVWAVAVIAHVVAPPAHAADTQPRVAIVVQIAPSAPVLGPDGQPAPGADAALARYATAIDELAGADVAFSLSVSPVFVDELRQLGSTGARTYAALLRIASRHSFLSRPYEDVSLPQLTASRPLRDQIEQGSAALQRTMDAAPLPVFHPPLLDLNDDALRAAQTAHMSAALYDANRVGVKDVRVDGVSMIPATTITSANYGRIDERIVAAPASAVVLDTPENGLAATLRALRSDRRFTLVPITDLVGAPPPGTLDLTAPAEPPSAYADAVHRATAAFDAFASYTLPGNSTRDSLAVLLAIARSTVFWDQRWASASAYTSAVVDSVSSERDLVTAAAGTVTLTARRGTVPVTVLNQAGYPVRVRVQLTSPKLSFPEGSSQTVLVSAKGRTITFTAETRSTGTFPMTIRLSSPDGSVRFDGSVVSVRSTGARVPALVLTGGAALFLLARYVRRLAKRRKGSKHQAAGGSPTRPDEGSSS